MNLRCNKVGFLWPCKQSNKFVVNHCTCPSINITMSSHCLCFFWLSLGVKILYRLGGVKSNFNYFLNYYLYFYLFIIYICVCGDLVAMDERKDL